MWSRNAFTERLNLKWPILQARWAGSARLLSLLP